MRIKIGIEVLLVIAAVFVLIYNISAERQIAYLASIVAVYGTIAFLIRDIRKLRK